MDQKSLDRTLGPLAALAALTVAAIGPVFV
jgi:hypothetical protein